MKGVHVLPTGGAETGLKRETEIKPNLQGRDTLPDRTFLLFLLRERPKEKGISVSQGKAKVIICLKTKSKHLD